MPPKKFRTPPSGSPGTDEHLLGRGVWRAPWLGPDGELVLLAVRRDHRLNEPPVTVPHGTTRADASVALVARLDRDDPPSLKLSPS